MQVPTTHSPPGDDSPRLSALLRYAILDTPPEQAFDDVVALAAALCRTPIALVSLLDRDRQWCKARTGFEPRDMPIGQAICAHAVQQAEPLVIPDLALDPRTAGNGLVTDDPKIRFYAGAPLVTPAGIAVGTVCVIDTVPRPQGLTDGQLRGLEALARQVVNLMEMREALSERNRYLMAQRDAGDTVLATALAAETQDEMIRATDMRSRLAEAAGQIGTFELEVASGFMVVSPQFCRIFGMPVRRRYDAAAFEALVVPEDQDIPSNAQTRLTGEAVTKVAYRIRRASDGEVRWIGRRAIFTQDASGRTIGMFGTVQDITDEKRAQARTHALLALGERLRDAPDTEAVARAASETLGQTLGVARAGYIIIDLAAGTMIVEADWTAPGMASTVGTHRTADFADTIEALQTGRILAIEDTEDTGDTGASGRAGSIQSYLGIRARIEVPMMIRSGLSGILFAHAAERRLWTQAEIDFAESVADQTYAAIAKIQAEANRATLNHELSHRLKNMLTMVLAIANQTLRAVAEREPVRAFEERLRALSTAHEILLQENWTEARIRTVVRDGLAAVISPDRFEMAGPNLKLGARATLSLALLVHELATNALKYGAFSNETGRVRIAWRIARKVRDGEVVLTWREEGGPPVAPPVRTGFGSRLIAMGLAGTGGTTMRYETSGFEAEFRASFVQMTR